MKYTSEYRENRTVIQIAQAISQMTTHPWNIMEICGGQTYAIAYYRLQEILPSQITLLHGPGCPVCVTPEPTIDLAVDLALRPATILATFGDMMRVPGSREDLLHAKARGADVRLLYSPLDAVQLAEENKDKEVIFFAIGFETTLPVHLTALREALRRGLTNFSLLTSFFRVSPAVESILQDPRSVVDAFLTAGHVCAITGNAAYRKLSEQYQTPMAVTGFEPADLLYGIYCCIDMLERGTYNVVNAYKRAVPEEGNPKARALMDEMLEPCPCDWRGIGEIPDSGLRLREKYAPYDAEKRFVETWHATSPGTAHNRDAARHISATSSKTIIGHQKQTCIAGDIMRGYKQPAQCPCFGTTCTPDHPVGAPMVSQEGSCATFYLIDN
ncbi:hydrogenase formation protein HypD [Bacteroidia bacterium]|nr:hydrogenase formation protein HypD [Bacteroidia bacterium]